MKYKMNKYKHKRHKYYLQNTQVLVQSKDSLYLHFHQSFLSVYVGLLAVPKRRRFGWWNLSLFFQPLLRSKEEIKRWKRTISYLNNLKVELLKHFPNTFVGLWWFSAPKVHKTGIVSLASVWPFSAKNLILYKVKLS